MQAEAETQLAGRRAGSWSWILQALTGFAVFILISLHMAVHHFVVEGGLRTYQDVLNYIRTPFFLVWEVIFLAIVTWHALLGVRAIIFDLGLTRAAEGRVTTVLTVVATCRLQDKHVLAYLAQCHMPPLECQLTPSVVPTSWTTQAA